MPDEVQTPSRRRRRNPITELIPTLNDTVTPTEVVQTQTQPLAPQESAVSSLALPEDIAITLPDIAGHAATAVGFTPNPSLPRVTDSQRVQDEVTYREQLHAAHNLRDSIRVAEAYVSAGVAATKLGRALIQYRVGIQDIRTGEVQLQKAQTKTAIATAELAQLNETLNYQNAVLPHVQQEYAHRLTEAMNKADRARLKAESYLAETDALFGS